MRILLTIADVRQNRYSSHDFRCEPFSHSAWQAFTKIAPFHAIASWHDPCVTAAEANRLKAISFIVLAAYLGFCATLYATFTATYGYGPERVPPPAIAAPAPTNETPAEPTAEPPKTKKRQGAISSEDPDQPRKTRPAPTA
jgi:hypothetical protein